MLSSSGTVHFLHSAFLNISAVMLSIPTFVVLYYWAVLPHVGLQFAHQLGVPRFFEFLHLISLRNSVALRSSHHLSLLNYSLYLYKLSAFVDIFALVFLSVCAALLHLYFYFYDSFRQHSHRLDKWMFSVCGPTKKRASRSCFEHVVSKWHIQRDDLCPQAGCDRGPQQSSHVSRC